MACPYYDFRNNDYYCTKKSDYVNSDCYYRYCRNYDYGDCPIYKNESSSGGCYISSACVYALGCKDDCYELNLLRNFRDTYVSVQKDGNSKIAEYYKVAPKIVEKINNQSEKGKIYIEIFNTYIKECIKYIEKNFLREAYDLYKKMYTDLKNRYLD